MTFSPAEAQVCERLARLALEEDLDGRGDLTSALLPADLQGRAAFVARAPGVVAGLSAARIVTTLVSPDLDLEELVADGSPIQPGDRLALLAGPMPALLTAERTALNFLQRLSGIATLTAAHVARIAGLPCKILDTRKTTPGWRLLEKFAVRMGGGHNHRLGLFDGVLIKDNHLAALGFGPDPIPRVIHLARERYGHSVVLEIEVDTLDQLDAALAAGPDIVLLDNMSTDQLREAVARRNAVAPGIALEASGGITLETLRGIAETGVDRISIGALTHSARALDIALDYFA